ncbi:hypothetical protein HGH93_12075 [Chitinophaga polysaccharea]|uniref:hypothetical protein n=1 Tax=Chitinophaga polysaccharea TaxID=1293035 RepID=UPI0014557AA3|nr:hypothetical protein [Chitinophaga polysaccharea]NLR58844.1 hypothetical protein [Chitinophaga polysaccharea]
MNAAQQMNFNVYGNVQVFQLAPEHLSSLPIMGFEPLGAITRQKPEITFNTARTDANGRKLPDGIEIRFGIARPTEATRQLMKDHGFQFSEKQTLWYAKDNAKSRVLAEMWTDQEVEVDTTQYIKQHFWARVKSTEEYHRLTNYTEFWVKTEPPQNFYSKRKLEVSSVPIQRMIDEGRLYFKKFFNRPVDEDEPQVHDTEPPDSTAIADRLQALADGMQQAIDEKLNSATSRQRPTNRRNRIVEGMEAEGRVLLQTQRVLYGLANAHRTGTITKFPLLENIRTKSQVGMLNLLERAREGKWREDWPNDAFSGHRENFARIGIESLTDWEAAERQKQAMLQEFLTEVHQQQDQEQDIRAMERDAWSQDIPGFFPTPRPLIERMMDIAELHPDYTILDPSAGKGDILDAIRQRLQAQKHFLYAAEINKALCDILRSKGYFVWEDDFLKLSPGKPPFNRILMNPPFEKGQDADHVMHALKFLAPGGRLVAVVSEGLLFRKNKKEQAFRQLLRSKNAYVSEPIEEAFRNAFHSTGVRVRLIAINEDGSPFSLPSANWQRPGLDEEQQNVTTADEGGDNMRMLELEAEAELELLRMRVEAERRKRGGGMGGITAHTEKLQLLRQRAWAFKDRQQVSDFK